MVPKSVQRTMKFYWYWYGLLKCWYRDNTRLVTWLFWQTLVFFPWPCDAPYLIEINAFAASTLVCSAWSWSANFLANVDRQSLYIKRNQVFSLRISPFITKSLRLCFVKEKTSFCQLNSQKVSEMLKFCLFNQGLGDLICLRSRAFSPVRSGPQREGDYFRSPALAGLLHSPFSRIFCQ